MDKCQKCPFNFWCQGERISMPNAKNAFLSCLLEEKKNLLSPGNCWPRFFKFFFSTLSIEILFSILEKYFFRAKTCSPELELKFFLHFSFPRFDFVSSHLLAERELVTHWHLFAMVVDIFSALWAFTFCCLFFKDAFFKKNLLSWSRIVIFFHLSFSSFDFFPNFSNVFKLAEWWTIKSMRYEPKRLDHTYLVLGCEDITVKC